MLKKLDRFVIKSFMGPMALTFLIVTFVLVMQFLWLYIDELVGKGLSFGIIMEFLMWGTATLFPLVLPLATLLASIMTLGNFGENNELLAMKAAGISLQRILTPLIIISVFISIAAFFASNNLIPLAYRKIYSLRSDIAHTREEIKLPTGIFYNGIENYTIRVKERDPKTSTLYGIMIYDHSAMRGNTNVTLAESGSIKLTSDKKNIVIKLYNGIRYQDGERIGYSDTSFVMQRIEFDGQEAIISLTDYGFKRSDDDRFGDEIMAQNLVNLGLRRDSLQNYLSYTQSNFKFRFLPSFRYSTQLDTSYNKNLTTLFPLDTLKTIPQTKERENYILTQVVDKINNQISIWEGLDYENKYTTIQYRKASLEWYRKFMLSFACIIFFFIGAPLGAIIRKGGLGTPVITSVFFFVIYWVIDIIGKKLATDGVIVPALGAIISTLVLLPIGIFLTKKSTSDSSLFNADAYIQAVNRFFKSVFQRNKSSNE
ncbi:MAG: LptF/LptG family permease [Prevotellaceae bacterium]|jgi:lipopolysaccharide export system permease protein|nr:LptF/LptG family permease [Prevotellaceae bacterium]